MFSKNPETQVFKTHFCSPDYLLPCWRLKKITAG